MNSLNKLIEDLSLILADSTTECDVARDSYKALKKVTKSTRDLIRNFEILKNVNGGAKK